MRQGKLEEAEAKAEAVLRVKPEAPEGHVLLALVGWRRGETDDALAECAWVLGERPDDLTALTLQALALWKLGEKQQVRQIMTQLAERRPELFNPQAFCRQVLCTPGDGEPIRRLLRRHRYLILPPS